MTDLNINKETEEKNIDLTQHLLVLAVVCFIVLIGNTVGPGKPFVAGLIGIIVLYVIVVLGLVLAKYVPLSLPSIAWISLVGIIATIPGVPGSSWVTSQVANVDFLALATPCLAYAGISITRSELDVARDSGWKIIIVAILVMTGTYVGSAFIAQLFL